MQLLALTTTCRQIFTEARLVPLSANKFNGNVTCLDSLFRGRTFDNARVLVITKLRLIVSYCHVVDHQGTFRINGPLMNMLLVVRGLPALKRITLVCYGNPVHYS